MKMKASVLSVLIVCAGLFSWAAVGYGQTDDQETTEIDPITVLDKFVGDWDEEIDLGGGVTMKAEGTMKWVMGKTHVLAEYTLTGKDGQTIEHMAMYTWDKKEKVYRSWMFSSDGYAVEAIGSWDAKNNVFYSRSVPDASGTTVLSANKFTDEDTIKWRVDGFDKTGKALFSMRGLDRRKK